MSSQRAAQLVEAGVWLQAKGDVDGAQRLFEEALKLDPSNLRASQALARLAGGPAPAPAPGALIPESPSEPPQPPVAPLIPPAIPPVPSTLIQYMSREELENIAAGRFEGGPAADARRAWEATNPGLDITVSTPPPRPRDALELLSDAPPRATPPPSRGAEDTRDELERLIRGARDLLELDDHSGAMDLIQKAAVLSPEDPVVQKLKERSEVVLQSMYESKLGRLDTRPRVVLRPDEIIWLNLDHRAGFVLAQIDGDVTYEDLFSICGMSRLDTARILSQLVQEGIIAGR
jgi:tetratricopeptide (TPR) repeat protein